MKMADTYEQPFPDEDLTEEDYIGIKELVMMKKTVEILDFKNFENDKGPGIYILFRFKGEEELHNTTTHSINIITILNKEKVTAAIENNDPLECDIVERPSKKDASKTVITLA